MGTFGVWRTQLFVDVLNESANMSATVHNVLNSRFIKAMDRQVEYAAIHEFQQIPCSNVIQIVNVLHATTMSGSMALTKGSFTSNSLSSLSIPSVVLLLGATDIVVVQVCTFDLYFQNVITEVNFHVLFHVWFVVSEYIADRLCPLDANNVRHEPTMETLKAFTIRDFDFYFARSYGHFICKFLTSWKRFKEELRFFRSCDANYPCGAGRDDNDSEDIMITVPATTTDGKLVSAHCDPTLKTGEPQLHKQPTGEPQNAQATGEPQNAQATPTTRSMRKRGVDTNNGQQSSISSKSS